MACHNTGQSFVALTLIAIVALRPSPTVAFGVGIKSSTRSASRRLCRRMTNAEAVGGRGMEATTFGMRTKSSTRTTSCQRMTNDRESDEYDRDVLGRSIRGFQSSALKSNIEPGDTVVCKSGVASLNIIENASYEVDSIYAQYFDDETQTVVKQPLPSLDAPIPPKSDRFVTLYSPVYHKDGSPVVVSPEEVGITSVRSELNGAALLAIPGFFWVFVASSFYNIYHERTGGSFVDAFWGR